MAKSSTVIGENVTESILRVAFGVGMIAAQEKANEGVEFHGSCGFALVHIPMRKNGRLHKVLKELGFSWNDYYKVYAMSVPNHVKMLDGTIWQSEGYRHGICQAMVKVLNANDIGAYTYSWID